MRTSVLSFVVLGLTAGAVSSQCVDAGPGEVTPAAPSKCLTIAAFSSKTNPAIYMPSPGNQYLAQMHTCQPANIPGVGGGVFYSAMTIYSAGAIYGNTSLLTSMDFCVVGIYDRDKCTWDPEFTIDPANSANKIATGFNMQLVSGGNFGLMIEPRDGLYAVQDQSGGVVFAGRRSVIHAFHAPVSLSALVPQTYVDPCLSYTKDAQSNDHLWLYWVAPDPNNANSNFIVRRELDISGYNRVTGTGSVVWASGSVAEIVAAPCQSSPTLVVNVHSPTVGALDSTNKNPHAMLMSERVASDSDEFFLGNLNASATGPSHTHVGPFYNGTAWTNNGGLAGGQLVYANSGAASGFYAEIYVTEAHWIGGDTVAAGSPAMFVGASHNLDASPNVIVPWLGLPLPSPVPVPGFGGKLSVNPLVFFPAVVQSSTNHEYEFQLPGLITAGFSGVKVAVQALSIDGTVNTFSNEAWLDIK